MRKKLTKIEEVFLLAEKFLEALHKHASETRNPRQLQALSLITQQLAQIDYQKGIELRKKFTGNNRISPSEVRPRLNTNPPKRGSFKKKEEEFKNSDKDKKKVEQNTPQEGSQMVEDPVVEESNKDIDPVEELLTLTIPELYEKHNRESVELLVKEFQERYPDFDASNLRSYKQKISKMVNHAHSKAE